MNYNSIQEIFDAEVTNMTVIRNNSYNDGSWDNVSGVDWLMFNGNSVSNIYVSGNSEIGFNTSSAHLAVNYQDASSYYVYREEGTLYDYYRFLRIRWRGYSYWNQAYDSYLQEYDVILWDTGNISLHMVDVPENSWSGTFKLLNVNYTKPTATTPDVTFTLQSDGSFVSTNELIVIDPPYDRKYLIQSGDSLFTVVEGVLTAVEGSVNADLFRTYGSDEIPSSDVLITLTDPVVLYWVDTVEYEISPLVAVVHGVPPAQTLVSEDYDMTDETILGIETVIVDASEDCLFAVSFDEGQTWKLHTGETWATLSEADTGMSASVMSAISSEDWNSEATTGKFRFRITIPSSDSYLNSLVVDYLN